MSHAFLSDAAEKVFTNLTRSEQAAVTTIRAALQIGPARATPGPRATRRPRASWSASARGRPAAAVSASSTATTPTWTPR